MPTTSTLYIPNDLFFAEVQAQIQAGKKVRIRVRGNSMLPFVRNNDEALLVAPQSEDIRKGTPVVAVTRELGIVLHRIHRIHGNEITLLGDGNIHQFEHTTPDRIIAVVSHFYRGRYTLPTRSWWMKVCARLWMAAHPWRRKVLNGAWKLKKYLFN